MKNFILVLILSVIFFSTSIAQKNLDYFVSLAKQNSPLINSLENQSLITKLDLEQMKRVLSSPEISLEANLLFAPIISHDQGNDKFEWISQGASDYIGFDQAFSDGGQYQAGVSLNQPLFKNSLLQAYHDKASITEESNQNQINLTGHELELLVTYQYILCLKSKKQKENTQAVLQLLTEQLNTLEILVNHAIYKQTDLMLLQIVYKNYELEEKNHQANLESNLYDLNLICGINDSVLNDIEDVNFIMKQDPNEPSNFLTRFSLDSLSLLSDLNFSKQKYKPQLSIFANVGMNAIYQPAFNRFGFNTGLTFSWVLFDGYQQKLQRQKTNVALLSVDFEKNHFKTQQKLQKAKLIKQISRLNEKEMMIEDQVKQYDLLIKTYQDELSTNQVSIMDLKNLIQESLAKKQELTLLKMEKEIFINSYNYWNY